MATATGPTMPHDTQTTGAPSARDDHASAVERRCRECGCTDQRACIFEGRPGVATAVCSWAEPDLCTACIPDIAPLVGSPATAHLWHHVEGATDAG